MDTGHTPLIRRIASAAFAFLALPGVIAYAVPLLLLRPPAGARFHAWGWLPLAPGIAGLLWCVREFFVTGNGTLAPWDPPRELVRAGLYRVTRNPMYVSVLLILTGWSLGYRSQTLSLYALVVAIAFHLRVVFFEEPWLARTFGAQWEAYRERVPRWFGPLSASRRSASSHG